MYHLYFIIKTKLVHPITGFEWIDECGRCANCIRNVLFFTSTQFNRNSISTAITFFFFFEKPRMFTGLSAMKRTAELRIETVDFNPIHERSLQTNEKTRKIRKILQRFPVRTVALAFEACP